MPENKRSTIQITYYKIEQTMNQSTLNRELFCKKALQQYSKMGTNPNTELFFGEEEVKRLIENSKDLTDKEFINRFDEEFGTTTKYANYLSTKQQETDIKTGVIIVAICSVTTLAIAITFIVKFIDLAKELHKIYFNML